MNIQQLRRIAGTCLTLVAAICIAYAMFSTNTVLYCVLGTICIVVSMLLFGFLTDVRSDLYSMKKE